MKVGDRIKCWTHREMIRKMMELASKGIISDVVRDKPNTLIITGMPEEEEEN